MDDDGNDTESVGKHKRKRRMMRLLHSQGLQKFNTSSNKLPDGNPYIAVTSTENKKFGNQLQPGRLKKCDSEKASRPKKKSTPTPIEDDYLLENIHIVKAYLARFCKWAWCYSQYCYPGLRTLEYYKKVKDKHDRKKKKELRKKEVPSVKKCSATGQIGTNCCLPHSNPPHELMSPSNSYVSEDDHDKSQSSVHVQNLVNEELKAALTRSDSFEDIEDGKPQWNETTMDEIKKASPTIAYFANTTGTVFQVSLFKWVCVLLAPIFLLGIHYVILKRKYRRLANKLNRLREDNDSLVEDCDKLEEIMSNTEKIDMPFSTKEEREEVVAEFTRLAESRIKAKKDLVHMSTKKAALKEELKMARRQRDQAREQYRSHTEGMIKPPANHKHHLQAAV